MDISAPMRPRMRDRSADFSINGIERIATRPKAVIIDTKYEVKPLKETNVEINNTEGYLALQKYKDFDKTKEIDGVIEEERRRSKAYNKIINQASSYQQVANLLNYLTLRNKFYDHMGME